MRSRTSARVGLVLIFISSAAIPGASAEATTIPIVIDDPVGLSEAWPLTCGVPFSPGRLKDTARLRLEDGKGRLVPSQIDVTATWLDGSVRWVLVSFQGALNESYVLREREAVSTKPIDGGIAVKEGDGRMMVDTGRAEFAINAQDALPAQASAFGRTFLQDGGRGAYVIDNQGRTARLGGEHSDMAIRFCVRGPMWTVVRKEGWYVVEGSSERIARGIVWMHFYGDCPYVKVVHRLVLTEDTNEVWFKDVAIDFPMRAGGATNAAFDTSKSLDGEATVVPLGEGETAWMLQDDFPHFTSKTSHFALVQKAGATERDIASGAACGDWCDLSGPRGGCTVVLRDFAEQFPKELTATTQGITAHLWAGRCGRELDFRTKTLVEEYWGEWTKYADVGVEGVLTIPSNAQASAKTHTLWLLPHAEGADRAVVAKRAHAAAERVLAIADPTWICKSGTMGPPMQPKDVKRFPKEEAFISEFFDRTALVPQMGFPLTGYIAWGSNPCTRIGRDKETGKYFAVWWRISGLVDYHIRRNTWTLYARSGERKYFDFGERLNRFAGDMNMHHWDYGPAGDYKNRGWKVKGGFATSIFPTGMKLKGGEGPGSYPIYWRWVSGKPGGSGADVCNYLFHFYFTGDWDVWELAHDFGEAIKKHEFLRTTTPRRGAFVPLRYLVWLYSMRWDEELGKLTDDLAKQLIRLDLPNAVNDQMPPDPLYKIGRNSIAMLDYYRLTGSELARDGFLKMIDYQYRFQLRDHTKPIAYQNASGMYYIMAWRLSGEDKYLRIASQSIGTALATWKTTLAEDLAPGLDKIDRLPYHTQCLNYHACLNMPVILRGLVDHQGALPPVPMLKKSMDSTEQAWAVFQKKADESVELELLFKPVQSSDVRPVVLGPALEPLGQLEVSGREQKIRRRGAGGVTPFYMRLRIPAQLPAGEYRVGHVNRGEFTVLDANVERIVLECPDGVWVSGHDPFYFRVPDELDEVKLFLGRPAAVTRSDGSIAADADGKLCGEVRLPVDGKGGFWSVAFDDPTLVRFRNLPPIVSYLTPKTLFLPEKLVPVAIEEPKLPDPSATFLDGAIGQGLQLNGSDVFRFARGKKLDDGTYENFPGHLGTIELYFRPNWTATETALATRADPAWTLLSAGSVGLRYRYGYAYRFYAFLDFFCGQSRYLARGRRQKYGNQARIFPKAGEWLHIAATWDTRDTTQDFERRKYNPQSEFFWVFVNGKRQMRTWSFPNRLLLYLGKSFGENYTLDEIPESITLGPGDGTFDELRISDTIRYEGDFTPLTEPFAPDEHTKALFHLDGSVEGTSGDGRSLQAQFEEAPGG